MAEFRTTTGNTKVKKGKPNAFFDFLIDYWYVLVGLMVATPYLMKWFGNLGAQARDAKAVAEQKDIEVKVKSEQKALETKVQASVAQNKVQDLAVNQTKEQQILKGLSKTIQDRLSAAAKSLAYNMGTAADQSWIKSLTENDAVVGKILTDNWYYFSYLEKLYQYVYTKNNNLKSDIYANLDDDVFKKVKSYFISKGLRALG